MKAWFFGLALAASPALGGQPVNSVAPIALYTEFQQPPPAAVLEGIQNELSRITEPLGIHFEWRNLADAHGDAAVPELVVVHFIGHCDLVYLLPRTGPPGALGWTHVSDGSVLPFSDIDCDGIRGFLQNGLIALRSTEREGVYGRAVGRVLAHELYHIVAKTQHHSAHGIAKPSYTVEDLLGREFRFGESDREEIRALRESVAAPPLPYNP
jgi:hypothetical protein